MGCSEGYPSGSQQTFGERIVPEGAAMVSNYSIRPNATLSTKVRIQQYFELCSGPSPP